mmetsp:Transcript_12080/g.51869  ORF Transcript_12080/g.51869 Transcript_12080/m.51869 type:complete len:431 (-) Transcript_12080:2736-4028(-)
MCCVETFSSAAAGISLGASSICAGVSPPIAARRNERVFFTNIATRNDSGRASFGESSSVSVSPLPAESGESSSFVSPVSLASSVSPETLGPSTSGGQNSKRTRFRSPGASVATCGATRKPRLVVSFPKTISNVRSSVGLGFKRFTDPLDASRGAVGGNVRTFPPFSNSNNGFVPHPLHGILNSRAPSRLFIVKQNTFSPTTFGAKPTSSETVSKPSISPNRDGQISTSPSLSSISLRSGPQTPNFCAIAPSFVTRSCNTPRSPKGTSPKSKNGGSNETSLRVTRAFIVNGTGASLPLIRNTHVSSIATSNALPDGLSFSENRENSVSSGLNLSEKREKDPGCTKHASGKMSSAPTSVAGGVTDTRAATRPRLRTSKTCRYAHPTATVSKSHTSRPPRCTGGGAPTPRKYSTSRWLFSEELFFSETSLVSR